LGQQGEFERAREVSERAVSIFQASFEADSVRLAQALVNLGSIVANAGDTKVARQHFERALAIFERRSGPNDYRTAHALVNVAQLYGQAGENEEARVREQRALAIFETTFWPRAPARRQHSRQSIPDTEGVGAHGRCSPYGRARAGDP
jgi:tetratricopeptide (TPR) repeat protein